MMDKSAADFRSLTADLEHTKYTDVVKDTSTETGQIFVRSDQKMRIEIIKPDPRTILRTGRFTLCVYAEDQSRRGIRSGQEPRDGGSVRSAGIRHQEPEDVEKLRCRADRRRRNRRRKTLVLELTPKSEDVRQQITKIQMWIDQSSWLPIQQKFFEAGSGDYFQFHYSNMMKNLKISDSKFKQDWPKDANRVKPRG